MGRSPDVDKENLSGDRFRGLIKSGCELIGRPPRIPRLPVSGSPLRNLFQVPLQLSPPSRGTRNVFLGPIPALLLESLGSFCDEAHPRARIGLERARTDWLHERRPRIPFASFASFVVPKGCRDWVHPLSANGNSIAVSARFPSNRIGT